MRAMLQYDFEMHPMLDEDGENIDVTFDQDGVTIRKNEGWKIGGPSVTLTNDQFKKLVEEAQKYDEAATILGLIKVPA